MKKVIAFFLLLVSFAAGAQQDRQVLTLDSFAVRRQGYDTLRFMNIFRQFKWNVTTVSKHGVTHQYTTTKPDTITSLDLSSVTLWAVVAVSPSLVDRECSMYYDLTGSVSVKLNGTPILESGSFAHGANPKNRSIDNDDFINFRFMDTVEKIEINYLPHPIAGAFELSLVIFPLDKGFSLYYKTSFVYESIKLFSFGFYYLAFGIVYFILFFFFKQKKENLYFSLFCIFICLSFFCANLDGIYAAVLSTLSALFAIEFTIQFLSKTLRNKERTKVPLALLLGLTVITLLPQVLYNYSPFLDKKQSSTGLYIVNKLFFFYELYVLGYLLAWGLRKKNKNAKIIFIFGLISTVLYTSIPILSYFFPALTWSSSGSYLNYVGDLALCTIPFGATIVLGRKNAENQKQLLDQEIEKKRILENQKESLEKEVALRTSEIVQQKEKIEKQHDELKIEKKKSDDLLLNILPEEVAEELKETGHSGARFFNNVTVLFTDFVDFTQAGERMSPQELVDELHICFKAFDEIMSRHHIEKIKTIGDAYLAVCGLPLPDEQHAVNAATAALEITQFIAERKRQLGDKVFEIRVGIHSGSVVAGIVGVKKFAYDIWGDTVNTAARMEQHGEPGKINISQTAYDLVKDKFDCTYRGEIKAKNKGELKMYFIEKMKPGK